MTTNFVIGLPHNLSFDPESEGWQQIKEPDATTTIVLGNIFSVLLFGLAYFVASTWWEYSFEALFMEYSLWFIPIFVGSIVLHERLHAVFHPGWGWSPYTLYGFIPNALLFFACYDASVTRSRYVAILVAPFIGLTVVPLLVAAIWPQLTLLACFIAVMNTAFSSLDLFYTALILRRTPPGSEIRNQGRQSYWRLLDE